MGDRSEKDSMDGDKLKLIEETERLDEITKLSADRKKCVKYTMGIGYMLAMGVCGVVLVALGSTLDDLAYNVGKDATEIGSVFIARGVGAVFGAIFSAKLYRWFQGNHVMSLAMLLISALLFGLPFNRSNVWLHMYFLALGLCTAVTDTGCQIMTRKLHGKTAGPWLGANTVAFGISGAFVPLIGIITESLTIQYYVISAIILGVTFLIFFGPNPESNGMIQPRPANDPNRKKTPHYWVEITIGFMVFCLIGGKVTSTAYLDTYVDDTSVIPEDDETKLILVLWIMITVGRLAGVYDQRFLTNQTLPSHLSIFLVGGAIAMLLVVWFPASGTALWIGVAFYGLFNGPCVGYCYDLNNRITYPTEQSMSVVMFGLNFGASLVPYITSAVWNATGSPKTLIYVIFLSMFLPLPFLHIVKYLSYDPNVNPLLKNGYQSVEQNEV